ncbi:MULTISPECIES: NUDIX hydrolase [unclassified Marinovum]
MEISAFAGAKLALFLGPDLLVIRRDDRADIPYPDHLDLPGGGREGAETAETCVLRETAEEVGLRVTPAQLIYRRAYQRPHGLVVFFAAHLPAEAAQDVVFGDEGQGWMLMAPEAFATHPEAVPHFREQLRIYLDQAAQR